MLGQSIHLNILTQQWSDLVRQARKQQVKIDWINDKLSRVVESGFTDMDLKQILKESK